MFRQENPLTQNMHPNMEDKYQKLCVILNVIQFTRWNSSPPWNENVLKGLLSYGEDTFLNACKELTSMQLNNLKTRDSGGRNKPQFSTIYYDIKPYGVKYVAEALTTLKEFGNPEGPRGMCFSIKDNDMTMFNKQRIIADSGTGNALPLFLDVGFLKALKSVNQDCFNNYISFLKENDVIKQTLDKIIPDFNRNLVGKGIDEVYKVFLNQYGSSKESEKFNYLQGSLQALNEIEQSSLKLTTRPAVSKDQ